VVLFIHGLPTSGRLWDRVVDVLQQRWTCVAVDLPGMGRTPPLRDHFARPSLLVEHLELLREQLSISSWHVVGHDAGAVIAVHYAAEHEDRVRRLVLCSPPIFEELRPPGFIRLLRSRPFGDLLAPFVNLVFWRLAIFSALGRDALTREIVKSFREPFTGWRGSRRFLRLVRWGEPQDVLARTVSLLPRLPMPTLIVHGTKDTAVPIHFAQRACRLIPNAELRLISSGHFLPLNRPQTISQCLVEFFHRSNPTQRELRFHPNVKTHSEPP
jgi:pimeloyl-ACP methyl ester carboxylesterase